MVATPGTPTIALSFTNLVINGSPAMTGTGSVNVVACSYVVNATTPDPVSVVGTIIQCASDNYPQAVGSHLTVSLDAAAIDISFDGSATASAIASSGGNTIAVCSINLAANPPSSSCSAP